MDMRRVILYAALALIIYSLWTSWQLENPTPSTVTPAVKQADQVDGEEKGKNILLPNLPSDKSETQSLTTQPASLSEDKKNTNISKAQIDVTTDVFFLKIDSKGDIVNVQLRDYPVSVEEPQTPITLLYDKINGRYIANSDLLIRTEKGTQSIKLNFHSAQPSYSLLPGQNQLKVTLEGQSAHGLKVKKEFVFTRGSYLIQVNYDLSNLSENPWQGYMNMQFFRSMPQEDASSIFHVGSYTGGSYSNPGKHRYQKVSFKQMSKSDLNVDTKGGWIAMQQHYFLSAWIPTPETKNLIYSRVANSDYTLGSVSGPLTVKPGENKNVGAKLYIGPENTAVLKSIAPGLELTVDYGVLWFLSSILFVIMKSVYSFIGNWGWSIVLITVLIKLAFYRLSASSYKSMAGMRKLQPKLQTLRERYGDDKAKISQATMELYRQEKINPLGGCLPILVQIPVFIALYWVLIESVELRQAPFIFWIKDLSVADPFHVLPIIMGITMLIQQRLNPAPPDPVQAKVMMFLPILFTGLFWNFPAGLVLYWIVNTALSNLQQWYITRRYGENSPLQKKIAK